MDYIARSHGNVTSWNDISDLVIPVQFLKFVIAIMNRMRNAGDIYADEAYENLKACGLRHLAFCVDSVEQTVKELRELGIECEPIRIDDYTDKKMTFFHDPDGLPLELHE